MRARRHLSVFFIGFIAVVAGCGGDATGPDQDPAAVIGTISIDASAGPAYLQLGDSARLVTVTDPSSSTAWDLSFDGSAISVNGGLAGPGGVGGYCICDNAGAGADLIRELTPAKTLPAFEGAVASEIPASSAFVQDELVPAIEGWYLGAAGGEAVANAGVSWIIRSGASSPLLSKFRVTAIEGASASGPGRVTFEYATQAAAGAPLGALTTETFDLGSGSRYFSLATGVVTEADAWDLQFDGWVIHLNGGVSGSGGVSAVSAGDMPFGEIDAALAASVPAVAYSTDGLGGVFATYPWYRYNLTGTDHQVWPTYDVYLIQRGTEVYKIQIVGYYNEAGVSKHLTLRYARLRS